MFTIELHSYSEHISNYIRKNGYWERIQTEILYEIFKKDKDILFVDIGANLGYFSLLASSLGINTISFEPIKSNYELFETSIKNNNFNNIKLYKFGLGDKEEVKEFKIIKYNMGCCTPHNLIFNDEDYKENVSIKLADEFLYEIDNDIVIKIDVENMELEVINGMLNTLSKGKVKYLLLEIASDDKSSKIFDILEKNNFNRCLLLEKLDHISKPNENSNHLTKIDLFKPLNIFKDAYDNGIIVYQHNFLFFRG